MEEFDFINQLNKGNKSAFEYVFKTYFKAICLFVQKYIAGEDKAKDIAQEVFITIWEKKLQFKNPQALKAYLYQTARNKSLNDLKHENVKKEYKEKMEKNVSSEDFYQINYVETETWRQIVKGLDKLPPRAKEIILLHLDGLSNKEIAEHLDISIYTVKNHKAAAYKTLKENLKKLLILILIYLFSM